MPTTTKGLRYPSGTDAVNAAVDMQNLAEDIDRTITETVQSAKGDLVFHNGTTEVAVPVGTNGQILVADSTVAAGVKWTTPPSITSNYVSIGTTTLTSAVNTISFSSIPQTYTDLKMVCNFGIVSATEALIQVGFRYNGNNSSGYLTIERYQNLTQRATSATSAMPTLGFLATATSGNANFISVELFSYRNPTTAARPGIMTSFAPENGGLTTHGGPRIMVFSNQNVTAAITSMEIFTGNSTFTIGSTATLYGIRNAA